MALTLSVPCADWLTPCEYSVTTRGVSANIWKNVATSCRTGPSRARSPRHCRRCSAPARSRLESCCVRVRYSRGRARHCRRGAPITRRTARCRCRFQSEEQIGISGGIGPAWIDHDDARAALLLVGEHALKQHRMAPGRVGADQHQQIGLVEVLVAAGHGVGAEGAAMAGDGRGHAQPRIGVDIGPPMNPFISLLAT